MKYTVVLAMLAFIVLPYLAGLKELSTVQGTPSLVDLSTIAGMQCFWTETGSWLTRTGLRDTCSQNVTHQRTSSMNMTISTLSLNQGILFTGDIFVY